LKSQATQTNVGTMPKSASERRYFDLRASLVALPAWLPITASPCDCRACPEYFRVGGVGSHASNTADMIWLVGA